MSRVIAYALLDHTVNYTGRIRLHVDDKVIGPVPRLTLALPLQEQDTETLLHHCDDNWNVLGTSSKPTLDETLAHAERAYEGVGKKWIYVNTTVEEAKQWIRQHHPLEICSFCGRFSYEVRTMIVNGTSVICSMCVDEFHHAIHDAGRGAS